MIVEFDKDYLKELYEDGKCTNRKYSFQPQVVSKLERKEPNKSLPLHALLNCRIIINSIRYGY